MIINDKMVVGVLKQILTAIFFKYLVNPFIPPYLFGIFPPLVIIRVNIFVVSVSSAQLIKLKISLKEKH